MAHHTFWHALTNLGGSIVGTVKDNAGALALGTAGIGLAKEGYERLGKLSLIHI